MYDSSTLTRRLQNKTIADGFAQRVKANTLPYGPTLGISNDSIITNVIQGQMSYVRKCGSITQVDTGCGCQNANNILSPNPILLGQYGIFLSGVDSRIYKITEDNQGNIYIIGGYASDNNITLQNASGNGQIPSQITLQGIAGKIGYTTFVAKYNSNGEAQWAIYLDRAGGNSLGFDITVSNELPNAYLYITGYYTSPTISVRIQNASGNSQAQSPITLPSTSTYNGFLVKYDLNGQAQWATYVPNVININNINLINQNSLYLDSDNNIYITGNYASLNNSITLQNASGNSQAPSPITLPQTSSSIANNQCIYLIKYNISGTVTWGTYINANGLNDNGFSIKTDRQNNIYITGLYDSTTQVILQNVNGNSQTPSSITLPQSITNTTSMFLAKYNSNGQAVWATFLNSSNSVNSGYSLTTDLLNNIYVTGAYNTLFATTVQNVNSNSQSPSNIILPGTNNYDYLFLIKYNQYGQALWATYLPGINNQGNCLFASDSNSNIYLSGFYRSLTNINIINVNGNSQIASNIVLPPTNNINNSLIIKYTSDGQAVWATYITGTNNSSSTSILTDNINPNNIYIAGRYNTTNNINIINVYDNGFVSSPITLPSTSGNTYGYLIKYTQTSI